MNEHNLISKAIETCGLQPLAKACGVTYQAVRKWEANGLPRTEWTKETDYAGIIARETAAKGAPIPRAALLAWSEQVKKGRKAA